MEATLAKYLARHAVDADWRHTWNAPPGFDCAVVIPACAEEQTLPKTLADLEAAAAAAGGETAVLVIVNQPDDAPADWREENRRTLEWLEGYSGPLHLAWADRASAGLEIPAKQGVGLARRIGLDQACRWLAGKPRAFLACLDADTHVGPDYLWRLAAVFEEDPPPVGAALEYAHPLDAHESAAICAYETYLRYHAIGLRYARSPYAFPTIGSAMAATVAAYAAIAGMPKRAAAEDFYFMQKLAKQGPVVRLFSTVVRPSARPSLRAPIGTGAQVARYAEDPSAIETVYHPAAYAALRSWITHASEALMGSGTELLAAARNVHPEVGRWAEQAQIERDWDRIAANTRPEGRAAAFHRWMDGFRTLKLVHHLRAQALPSLSLSQAVPELLAQVDAAQGGAYAKDLSPHPARKGLAYLRTVDPAVASDAFWDPPGGPLGIGLSAR